jgi:hypothetical protein
MRHLGARRQPGEGAWLGRRAGADVEVTGAQGRHAGAHDVASRHRARPVNFYFAERLFEIY